MRFSQCSQTPCTHTPIGERPRLSGYKPYVAPTSDFTLSKYSTDICDSEIEFFDKSIGGYSYLYLFDDSTFISTEQNPIHLYYSDGTKYPMQIVTNEWGCKDSSFQKLYIEMFQTYIKPDN